MTNETDDPGRARRIQTGRALHGEREAMLQLAASSGP